MTELLRWPVFRYSLFICASFAAAFLLLPDLRHRLLASNFLPHATCYLQNPQLIWLHASSDSIIGLAYLAISSTLAYLVYRARQDIPFHWMFLAFGLFIVTCGFTHLMEVWTVWQPVYWLAGWVKLVTAAASLATAIVLPLVIPKVNGLIKAAKLSEQRRQQLQTANNELETLYRRVKELDELRTQFFANVSHELRTPLTLILSPVREMQRAGNLSEGQRGELRTIERNGHLLLKHVNELLDAAKLEAGKMQLAVARINLTENFRLLLANFQGAAQSRSISMRVNLPEMLVAEVDPEKVERVWLNLLSNALKFTPDRGEIVCQAGKENGNVWFSISDSGPGIPDDKRSAVFERFRQLDGGTTRKHGGTGLGLAISKEFVDLHGGRIWVERASEGGARFVVELPARAPGGVAAEGEPALRVASEDAWAYVPAQEPARTSPEKMAHDGLATVLVAEDSPELNRFICENLGREYRMISARNGKEALEMLRQQVPDAVISDAMMPEMSGDSLMAEARALPECRDVPFLFLTARTDDEFKIRVLREGAQDFVGKPFSIEELRARMKNIVAMSRSRSMLQKAARGGSSDIVALVDEVLTHKRQLEAANRAAEQARLDLQKLNEDLESKVQARTAELAEANDELSAFTSSVSHDLRAPLRTMRGMADILLEVIGQEGSEEVRHYASRIMAGADKMDTLLKDLLTYSRLGRGELALEVVNAEETVTGVLAELSADITERKAVISREGALPNVKGSATLLKQIASNLLGNAIKYVPQDRTPHVRVWFEEAGPNVRIWVEDNGLGIAPEHRSAVFEPFKRLHSDATYTGTGLGLAIALKAARRMGGNIGLESDLGKGSRFWVELQRADWVAEAGQ
jgi:signal transduction histidine kinase